jgi:hypothetical protein
MEGHYCLRYASSFCEQESHLSGLAQDVAVTKCARHVPAGSRRVQRWDAGQIWQ